MRPETEHAIAQRVADVMLGAIERLGAEYHETPAEVGRVVMGVALAIAMVYRAGLSWPGRAYGRQSENGNGGK